jgi:hypothetical protein
MTDEQRSRRPIFIAIVWAGGSWLFFRVARSIAATATGRRQDRETRRRQDTGKVKWLQGGAATCRQELKEFE